MDDKNCCGVCGCGSGKMKTWLLVLVIVVAVFFAAKAIKEFKTIGFVGKELSPSATIMVSGEGEVLTKPDIASFSFTVEKESLNVAEAQSGSAKIVNDILAELKKLGVAEKDIKTLGYNIYPRYEYPKEAVYSYYPSSGERVLAGYVVSQTIEVKVRKIADAGKIISSIGELGATNLSGLSFSVDKEEEFTAEARKKAIDNARSKAEILAKDLSVTLVRITSFSESGNYPGPIYYTKSMEASGMGGGVTPDMPSGENRVVSNVTLTYEIR